MSDPTYKTFLAPGSCKLEVTSLVAAANDDGGVDLAGVKWEIEQCLIAGLEHAVAPTDTYITGDGVLIIGRSLMDKVNASSSGTNIPGQCTIVVKATSLVDPTKVARLKILVGIAHVNLDH